MLTAEKIKALLKLEPNTFEGGFFASTYISDINIPEDVLTGIKSASGSRSICSAIYYFLEAGTKSVLHKVGSDMIYHFYSGDQVEMLLLYPKGHTPQYEVCTFGTIAENVFPMKIIPGGTWLGSRLIGKGAYALMGVSMAPGFDKDDYSIGDQKELIKQYPEASNLIKEFTK